jgi:hypothetical protein
MAAPTKRAQPATHPTVYVGLALAAVGLLLALYAYTGTRIYDIRFVLVAIGGAALAIVGIFVSAWGRAIMASRAQRSRRALIHDDALRVVEEGLAPPPTVAEPPSKKRFDFKLGARKPKAPREEPVEKPAKGAFAFKRRAAPPPPPAPPAEEGPVVAVVAEPHPAAAPLAASAEPALERVTVRCPRCATEFTAEGVRPIPITCPSCGLAGSL